MIEFAEGAASVGLVAAAVRLAFRWRVNERLPDGVLSRRILDSSGDFKCPECCSWVIMRHHGKRCTCDEYWEPHRHFECSCGLKAIMQLKRVMK